MPCAHPLSCTLFHCHFHPLDHTVLSDLDDACSTSSSLQLSFSHQIASPKMHLPWVAPSQRFLCWPSDIRGVARTNLILAPELSPPPHTPSNNKTLHNPLNGSCSLPAPGVCDVSAPVPPLEKKHLRGPGSAPGWNVVEHEPLVEEMDQIESCCGN